MFRAACQSGHLHICQWLLQVKADINISVFNEYAFRGACFCGLIKRFSLDDLGEEKDIITKPIFIIGYSSGKTGDFARYLSSLAKRQKYFTPLHI